MVVGGGDDSEVSQSKVEILSSTLKEACLVEIGDVIGKQVREDLNLGFHAGQVEGLTGNETTYF